MPRPPDTLDLAVDLAGGVVPISKAASALAALFKRSRERRQPVIITQKGYPSGVLLPIDLYVALRELAEQVDGGEVAPPTAEASPPPVLVEPSPPEPAAPPPEVPAPPRTRGGRKARSKPAETA